MSTEVLTAIISAVTTLIVSIGTWNISMRQYRVKNMDMVDKAIADVKDSVTATNAQVQEHLSIIDLKIETLSERVEKHNQVLERLQQLQTDVQINAKEIEHLRERMA